VVAAPIFQRIATAALRQHGISPSINAPDPLLAVRWNEAGERTASGPIAPQSIAPLAATSVASMAAFPDLTGLGAREALGVLARLGYTARLRGAGLVTTQSPEPGTPLDSSTIAVLTLERRARDRVARAGEP
jgi:hypothetical protein